VFVIHRSLQNEASKTHVVDAPRLTSRRRRRARPTSLIVKRWFEALLAYSAANRGSCNGQGSHSRRGFPATSAATQSANRRESAHVNRSKGVFFTSPGHIRIRLWPHSAPACWKNSTPATAAPSLRILKRCATVSSIG